MRRGPVQKNSIGLLARRPGGRGAAFLANRHAGFFAPQPGREDLAMAMSRGRATATGGNSVPSWRQTITRPAWFHPALWRAESSPRPDIHKARAAILPLWALCAPLRGGEWRGLLHRIDRARQEVVLGHPPGSRLACLNSWLRGRGGMNQRKKQAAPGRWQARRVVKQRLQAVTDVRGMSSEGGRVVGQ